jgi:KDO2-lipid IV(A) lauroyltransferase
MVDDVFGPEDYLSQPDPLYYLTARYRRSIENLVRVAPSQYLWMHRIWKSRPRHERLDRPFPDSLRRKLGELPWMDDAGVEAIADQSDRDRAFLTERGLDRMP